MVNIYKNTVAGCKAKSPFNVAVEDCMFYDQHMLICVSAWFKNGKIHLYFMTAWSHLRFEMHWKSHPNFIEVQSK